MIMTITEATTTDSLDVEFRGCVPATTIAPSGSATFGVSMADLYAQADAGNPAWKYLDTLVKKGLATITFAADANDVNVLDEANEV
jgi:hypothetical protein